MGAKASLHCIRYLPACFSVTTFFCWFGRGMRRGGFNYCRLLCPFTCVGWSPLKRRTRKAKFKGSPYADERQGTRLEEVGLAKFPPNSVQRKDLVWFRQKGGCEMLQKRHRRMGQCVGGPAWGERPQRFVAEWLVRVWLWLVPNF